MRSCHKSPHKPGSAVYFDVPFKDGVGTKTVNWEEDGYLLEARFCLEREDSTTDLPPDFCGMLSRACAEECLWKWDDALKKSPHTVWFLLLVTKERTWVFVKKEIGRSKKPIGNPAFFRDREVVKNDDDDDLGAVHK